MMTRLEEGHDAKQEELVQAKKQDDMEPFDDSNAEDYVHNYTRSMMMEGLSYLSRKRAVRTGNGPDMLDTWKMLLPFFFQESHPHYFIIAHHMLTSEYELS